MFMWVVRKLLLKRKGSNMRWDELDSRLKRLYNCIVQAHSETVSINTSMKSDDEAFKIMSKLTQELNKEG